MKLLGFSAQKPLYQAWQHDAAAIRHWEAKTYPEIKAQARAAGATICFANAVEIRSDYAIGTTCAPVGKMPTEVNTVGRFSVNMISAISPRGDYRFMVHEGSVTTTAFKEFLSRLMMGVSKPVFVIADGRPVHKSQLVKDYVDRLNGQLQLFYLSPCSSHLNPDE